MDTPQMEPELLHLVSLQLQCVLLLKQSLATSLTKELMEQIPVLGPRLLESQQLMHFLSVQAEVVEEMVEPAVVAVRSTH
jgi:hypothetical protein